MKSIFRLTRWAPMVLAVAVASGAEETSTCILDATSAVDQSVALAKTGTGLKASLLKQQVHEVVFATRSGASDGHWYANIGYYSDNINNKTYETEKGGRLCVLSVDTGEVRTLLDDRGGNVRDPQLNYDGKTILFSYRKGGEDAYHLYTMKVDGTELTQLTFGIYDDFEPTYMPDGTVMFISTRARRWVNCWYSQVGTLHRMNADGSDIQLISANVEHDNHPWPLADGRILYTRWEYVDRNQVNYHHLWTSNPDGTGQMVYYGNMHPGGLFIDAKPIQGTDKVLLINSPGHGRREHGGSVAVLSVKNGPDDESQLKDIAVPPESDVSTWSPLKEWYRDPYPVSDEIFLVSLNHKLLVMDYDGNYELLLELQDEDINEPRPVRARPHETMRPTLTDPDQSTGKLLLTSAYLGRNMKGIQPGEIKNLLVMETLPKPVNFSGSMEPLSWGGTYTLERILGKIPVEADGSAFMELPAKRSLFFIALDENDRAVKRMQSFLTVMPGEMTSCVGCHEERMQTPVDGVAQVLLASKRPASRLTPVTDVPDLFNYPTDIQPILDTHCVACHNPEKRGGGIQLTGDLGPLYSHSYYWLSMLDQLGDNRNRAQSNYPPYALGDAASPLMQKIRKGHHQVKLSDYEQKMVQYWLHAGAPYLGSYAGLGTGVIGADFGSHRIDRSDLKLASIEAYQDVLERRCSACHQTLNATKRSSEFWPLRDLLNARRDEKNGAKKVGERWEPVRPLPNATSDVMMNAEGIQYGSAVCAYLRHAVFNLTRPEKSTLLMAPLAQVAGGYATDEEALNGHPAVVFKDTSDPDYQIMLGAIQDMADFLNKDLKRWYMPGFKPHPSYIREMKRYGVLPECFDVDTDLINVYETDAKYFQMQHYYPPNKKMPDLYQNTWPLKEGASPWYVPR